MKSLAADWVRLPSTSIAIFSISANTASGFLSRQQASVKGDLAKVLDRVGALGKATNAVDRKRLVADARIAPAEIERLQAAQYVHRPGYRVAAIFRTA